MHYTESIRNIPIEERQLQGDACAFINEESTSQKCMPVTAEGQKGVDMHASKDTSNTEKWA